MDSVGWGLGLMGLAVGLWVHGFRAQTGVFLVGFNHVGFQFLSGRWSGVGLSYMLVSGSTDDCNAREAEEARESPRNFSFGRA